jgi:hypothetical protein
MLAKPLRADRKKHERRTRRERRQHEATNKRAAIDRDGCRFPRCGCRRLGLAVHGAHREAKGIGGDHGRRSTLDNLLGLCVHRHQSGFVSIHAGTLKPIPLTDRGTNGPIAWEMHTSALGLRPGAWVRIVEELEPDDDLECLDGGRYIIRELHAGILDLLADMEF